MPPLTAPTTIGGWAAIISAIFSGLAMLELIYLQNRGSGPMQKLIKNGASHLTNGSSTATNAGGGSARTRVTVLPWLKTDALPQWSQNTQVDPEGGNPSQHWNECGETCCAMVIAGVWGVPVEPGALVESIGGPGNQGLTTGDDLVAILKLNHVAAESLAIGPDLGLAAMKGALADDRPVIILGTWPTPGGVLHWLLATSVDAKTVRYINPWTGQESWIPLDGFLHWFANSLVIVHSHLHFNMRGVPTP